MTIIASQSTTKPAVSSTAFSWQQKRKHQGSASMVFCEGNTLVTGGFPLQRDSHAQRIPMSWCYHRPWRIQFPPSSYIPPSLEDFNFLYLPCHQMCHIMVTKPSQECSAFTGYPPKRFQLLSCFHYLPPTLMYINFSDEYNAVKNKININSLWPGKPYGVLDLGQCH